MFAASIEEAALFTTRLFLVFWALFVMGIFGARVRMRRRWLAIPKPTRLFSISWTLVWSFFPIYIFFGGSNVKEDWFIASYGTAYLGMLSGLVWCLWYATKELPEPEAIEKVHDAVVEVVAEELAKSDLLDRRGNAYGGF